MILGIHVSLCMGVPYRSQRETAGLHIFLRQRLSLSLELTIPLEWLALESQESSCLGLSAIYALLWMVFIGSWGSSWGPRLLSYLSSTLNAPAILELPTTDLCPLLSASPPDHTKNWTHRIFCWDNWKPFSCSGQKLEVCGPGIAVDNTDRPQCL